MPLSPQSVRTILLAGLLMSIVGLPGGASGQGLRHFREGREAYQRGDFDEAIRHYTRSLIPSSSSRSTTGATYTRQNVTTSAPSRTIAKRYG